MPANILEDDVVEIAAERPGKYRGPPSQTAHGLRCDVILGRGTMTLGFSGSSEQITAEISCGIRSSTGRAAASEQFIKHHA